MPGGFGNKPKILRGAFVEYGLSLPPLIVPFQFNPVQLSRSRSLSFRATRKKPAKKWAEKEGQLVQEQEESLSLKALHQKKDSLLDIRDEQTVDVQEETISFEIRLDATDKLNQGDTIAEQFGIAPQLATLEAMVQPKSESFLGELLPNLETEKGFSFTKSKNPPMILFIWGRKRVLPVNINGMDVTETEFSADLNPIRATVSVSLIVIEGPNVPYSYSKAMKEAMSVLNLANLTSITDVVIPG
jgi:hypothetical protein